ncbi:hypothetical protein [Streptomyces sp. NPDC097610]|uniref:hypothetical protein n=1 Tax=Streptomyces sp. NPDC097610 TaxID=3157227 RepID=UPI00331DEAD1
MAGSVGALRQAGAGEDQVVLLPADHRAADTLVDGADRVIVYGGDDVVARYAHDPGVLPQGPGRTKILTTADTDWRSHLDPLVGSIADEGGTACVNATAILVEGDPAPLARAVAERLAMLPRLPPQDERAALPVVPLSRAHALSTCPTTVAAGARAWLAGDGIAADLGDGSAVLRDTLVLSALTRDQALLEQLLARLTIANLYIGDHSTCRMAPGVPPRQLSVRLPDARQGRHRRRVTWQRGAHGDVAPAVVPVSAA